MEQNLLTAETTGDCEANVLYKKISICKFIKLKLNPNIREEKHVKNQITHTYNV